MKKHVRYYVYLFQGQEEIQDFCRSQGISHLVILKDTDSNTVKVSPAYGE